MSTQEIEHLIQEWITNNSNMKYALIIHHPDKKPLISYATEDYKDLLETYDIEDLSTIENFTPQEVIEHEIEAGEIGYIYSLNPNNGEIILLAKYEKGRVK